MTLITLEILLLLVNNVYVVLEISFCTRGVLAKMTFEVSEVEMNTFYMSIEKARLLCCKITQIAFEICHISHFDFKNLTCLGHNCS